MPDGVQLERAGFDDLHPVAVVLGETQQIFHAQHQLAWAERLGDVVVCPQLESADAILLGRPRGEHEDRHIASLGILLEQSANLESVDARQHQVEHEQAGDLGTRHLQRLVAGVSHGHFEILLLQMKNDQLEHIRFVIDNKDSGFVFFGHDYSVPGSEWRMSVPSWSSTASSAMFLA